MGPTNGDGVKSNQAAFQHYVAQSKTYNNGAFSNNEVQPQP